MTPNLLSPNVIALCDQFRAQAATGELHLHAPGLCPNFAGCFRCIPRMNCHSGGIRMLANFSGDLKPALWLEGLHAL